MKKRTVFRSLILLLLLSAVLLLTAVACKKNTPPDTDNTEKGRKVSVSTSIWFADEASYVDGVLDDSRQLTNMEMKVGKSYYAVVDVTVSRIRDVEEIGQAELNIDVTPSRVAHATVEVSTVGSLKERYLLDTKNLTVDLKLPDPSVPQKKYRVVIAITPLELGEVEIESSLICKDTEVEGYPVKKTTASVNGSEISPSPLEYQLSEDGTYYTVIGIGQTQGGIVTVPQTYESRPVKAIGDMAFYGSQVLKKLNLPEGLERIGESAFEKCGKLFDINLPSTVKEVGENAFKDGMLRSASAGIEQIKFLPKDNLRVLYITGSGNISEGLLTDFNELMTLTVLNGEMTADENALSELNLLIATVHSSFIKYLPKKTVMYINVNAGSEIASNEFSDFEVLLQISLYSGIERVESDAFVRCSKLSVILNQSKVFLSNTYNAAVNPTFNKLTRVGDFIYENETRLKAYLGDSGEVSIPEIGDSICDHAFRNSKIVKSVFVPKNITNLGNYVFQGCSELETVRFDDDISVTSIGGMLENCESLKNLEIPKSITEIDDFTLYGATGVETITVSPNNTTFRAEGNCVIKGNTIVLGCKGSDIPQTKVTSIKAYAFRGVTGLTSLNIPANIGNIEPGAFWDCSNIVSIEVAADNAVYESVNNCIIEKSGKALVLGCKTSVIPDGYGITEILPRAFIGCDIKSVIVPTGVRKIGARAFSGCEYLESVTLPDTLTYIGENAFSGATALGEIKIPRTVTYVGASAFDACSDLVLYIQNRTDKSGWEEYWDRKGRDASGNVVYHKPKSYE